MLNEWDHFIFTDILFSFSFLIFCSLSFYFLVSFSLSLYSFCFYLFFANVFLRKTLKTFFTTPFFLYRFLFHFFLSSFLFVCFFFSCLLFLSFRLSSAFSLYPVLFSFVFFFLSLFSVPSLFFIYLFICKISLLEISGRTCLPTTFYRSFCKPPLPNR